MGKVFHRGKEGDMSEGKIENENMHKWREIVTEKRVLKILSVSSEFLFDGYGRVLK